MNVLSLCDGMSCGQIALEKAGIVVDNYYASEIKETGIKVTMANYPGTIQIGDVTKVHYKDGVLYTENGNYETKIDLVMFGSPCQTFSIAIPTESRIGFDNLEKSGLFFECYRVLKEVNPKYFLMENVRSMKDCDRDIISSLLRVKPVMIDSSMFAPAIRKRYYWTNIRIQPLIEKHCDFNEILTSGYSERKKARCLAVIDSRPNTTPVKMFHRYYSTGFTTLIFKDKKHYEECVNEYIRLSGGKRKCKASDLDNYTGDVFNGVRYMNKEELAKCQTIPVEYVDCLTRNEAADVLGDGWTVDVIAHIFKGLKDNI